MLKYSYPDCFQYSYFQLLSHSGLNKTRQLLYCQGCGELEPAYITKHRKHPIGKFNCSTVKFNL